MELLCHLTSLASKTRRDQIGTNHLTASKKKKSSKQQQHTRVVWDYNHLTSKEATFTMCGMQPAIMRHAGGEAIQLGMKKQPSKPKLILKAELSEKDIKSHCSCSPYVQDINSICSWKMKTKNAPNWASRNENFPCMRQEEHRDRVQGKQSLGSWKPWQRSIQNILKVQDTLQRKCPHKTQHYREHTLLKN